MMILEEMTQTTQTKITKKGQPKTKPKIGKETTAKTRS